MRAIDILFHRLLMSEKYVNAAMIPFFESRIIEEGYRYNQIAKPVYAELTKAPIDYYKRFYSDVEIRTPGAVLCTYQFFGPEHVLFATGMPYGPMGGYAALRNSINCIEQLPITEEQKQMIFFGKCIQTHEITDIEIIAAGWLVKGWYDEKSRLAGCDLLFAV